MLRAGDLADRATFFRNDLAFEVNPNTTLTKDSHPFAARIATPVTSDQMVVLLQTQAQIATFLASGGVDIIDPDGTCLPDVPGKPGCLFEVPIELPLPEDLGFIP